MNVYNVLQSFLQRSIPTQADFENLVSLLDTRVIGQVYEADKKYTFFDDGAAYLLVDAQKKNIYNYPLLFKNSFKSNNLSFNSNDYNKFYLNNSLSGSFLFAGEKADYSFAGDLVNGLGVPSSFIKSFSIGFYLSALSGLACFQAKNKNFPVNTVFQAISTNNSELFDKASIYQFATSPYNIIKLNTNFLSNSSFNTSLSLLSSAPVFYNYEPVLIFNFSKITNFSVLSSSIVPVLKNVNDNILDASLQLVNVSGYDVPISSLSAFSSDVSSVTSNYTWIPLENYAVSGSNIIIFLDNFYPYGVDYNSYIKLSFLSYKNNLNSTTLSSTSSFSFNSFTSLNGSLNAYISSFFSQSSASNLFPASGVNIWTNTFMNEFIASFTSPQSTFGAFFFGV
ncbi:MAG: hypothetical protein EBU90_22945 [Proteobacteria bacterium]|nr:hypothetical protein [Pseudomonadota bacterium]NBP15642.1 hypothetical protein [bacterium]